MFIIALATTSCVRRLGRQIQEKTFFWSKVKSGDFVKQAGAEDFS